MARASFKLVFSSDIKSFNKSIKKMQMSVKKFRNGLNAVDNVATTGFLALGGALTAASKQFGDMEESYLKFKTLLEDDSFKGKTLEEGYSDIVKQAQGLTEEFAVSAGDVGTALFDIQSGIGETAKILPTLRAATRLAVGGGADLSTTTEALVKAVAAYGFSVEEIDGIAASFFKGQKKGILDVQILAEGFANVAGSASAFGVNMNEVLAAISVGTTKAVKGDVLSRSLKQFILTLVKPSNEAVKALKRINKQYNTNIEFSAKALEKKGFTKILKEIQGIYQKDKALLGQLIPDKTTLGNIVGLLAKDKFAAYEKAVAGANDKLGAQKELTIAVNKVNEGQNAQLTQLINTIKNLAYDIGNELSPQVIDLIKRFKAFIQDLKKNPEEVKKFVQELVDIFVSLGKIIVGIKVAKFATTMIGAIISISGYVTNLVMLMGSSLYGAVGMVVKAMRGMWALMALIKKEGFINVVLQLIAGFKAWAGSISLAKVATGALTFSLKAFRLALIGTGIGALILGVVYLISKIKSMNQVFIVSKAVIKGIAEVFRSFVDIIASVGKDLGRIILSPFETIASGKYFTNTAAAFKRASSNLGGIVKGASEDLRAENKRLESQYKIVGGDTTKKDISEYQKFLADLEKKNQAAVQAEAQKTNVEITLKDDAGELFEKKLEQRKALRVNNAQSGA